MELIKTAMVLIWPVLQINDIDNDNDGYTENEGDCNDQDQTEHPGQTWYKDIDDDGYTDETTDTLSCTRPNGYKVYSELSSDTLDEDDNDETINPGETEICADGKDNDQDGEIDEECGIPEIKMLPSDGAASDQFGFSLSISGDYAIVGAYFNDGNDVMSGSAYIFQRSGSDWIEIDKLISPDSVTGDYFGISVSISGDYAIVGAMGDEDKGPSSGSAYIFQRSGNNWNLIKKLTASDGETGDSFGESVSISGDYAIIGAKQFFKIWPDPGSAYIFQRYGSDWVELEKLNASDSAAGDAFGISVSISGDYAIVGASGNDDYGAYSGSAYIFQSSGSDWVEVEKLNASDGAADDRFGVSVSISGGYAIVGASTDDENGVDSGSAYIFQRSGSDWIQVEKLTTSNGVAGDHFGHAVSISGDNAIVGAIYADDNGSDSGSAYIFQRSGSDWIEVEKLNASDGKHDANFGRSVSISGNNAIVGAPNYSQGSAYSYSF